MIELPLVFLGGLLGSAHCVAMCGGFAVRIGLGARGFPAILSRQVIYSAGRIFTYAFLGVAGGYAGTWLAHSSRLWINAQAILCMIAGAWLLIYGLLALGVIPRRLWPKLATNGTACLAGTFVGPFLASRARSGILLAGVLTGFLPCGLVYAFLALATSSASVWTGLLTMCLFGAGTAPLLILTGASGSLLSHYMQGRLLRISALCVCFTGLISIARGILFLQLPGAPEAARCLLCGPSTG
jgi:sulfite exporter TauE/SafE